MTSRRGASGRALRPAGPCPGLLLVSLLAAGCRAPQAGDLRLSSPPGFASPADYPGARGMLEGFDAAAPAADWQAGDEVLFGLQLRRGGSVRRWLLHLRLTEPTALARAGDAWPPLDPLPPVHWSLRVNGAEQAFLSARCRVLATVADAEGRVLGRSEPLLPRDFLARGFTAACARVAARRASSRGAVAIESPADTGPFVEATVAAVALLQVVQEDDVLAPLLWEVVDKPSLWSVVTHLGAAVVLAPRFLDAEPVPSPVAVASTAWRVPMALSVNDQPALHTDLFVVPASRPWALCGGVVGASARHPRDPDREFSLLLLAARTGPPRPGPSRPGTTDKSEAASCR